jgi:hypothetical protein
VAYFEVVATANVAGGRFRMRHAPQERIVRHTPEHRARQGSSQVRPQTGEANGIQIAGANEEITEAQS